MSEPQALSVLDVFSIGVGPSSSHTMGPWLAARGVVDDLRAAGRLPAVTSVRVELFGSLAKTGTGHGTPPAVMLGLMGEDPATADPGLMTTVEASVAASGILPLGGEQPVGFTPDDVVLRRDADLPGHPNGMRFTVAGDGWREEVVRYSTGGGSVADEAMRPLRPTPPVRPRVVAGSGAELLAACTAAGVGIAEFVVEAESAWRPWSDTRRAVVELVDVMLRCVHLGCRAEGRLPGGLQVTRRAGRLAAGLRPSPSALDHDDWRRELRRLDDLPLDESLRWVSAAALAVNEQNAAYQRVVTAPTNGSAGVIPAVLVHLLLTRDDVGDDDLVRFLLVASEVGALITRGATISAALGGCQAEIGASSAMAAAALADAHGASPAQALMAAEIALEHHLGLTCDPVGGLVQVPCIERNALGATKAISAAMLARHGEPSDARVSFDDVVRTMWATARDMDGRYKETSEAGLAVQISVATAEC